MWMAQGFIQPQEGTSNQTIESVGDEYFDGLSSRCLFQDIVKDDRERIKSAKLHDIMHDIACKISSDKNLNITRTNLNSKKVINSLPLRVLSVNYETIYMLSNSIDKLKHLRYLEISEMRKSKLPKSISLLYNLQTLKINTSIDHLPQNLREFVNLRHLEYSEFLKKMPPYLSQMTQLQTLSRFTIGLQEGCNISELGPLNNLKGSLELACLDKVKSEDEGSKANLVHKENLENLNLFWSKERKDISYNDLEVLKGLQPHEKLRSLKLNYFAGTCLPNKIFVENLRIIELYHCENCETLPILGQLNNLKELMICCMGSIRSIGDEFYGNYSNQKTIFSKLEKFILKDVINLEQWKEPAVASNVKTFPHLMFLEIHSCDKLLNIPNLFGFCDENGVGHLKHLIISSCNRLRDLPTGLQNCRSIERLAIINNSNLMFNLQNMSMLLSLRIQGSQKLPKGLGNLINLKDVIIWGCMQNFDFNFLSCPSLMYLYLNDQSKSTMIHLPQQLQHLTALKVLILVKFDCIEVLPEWLGNLKCLNTLGLYFCKNLKQLPSQQALLRLSKLCNLYVYNCPQLQLGEGEIERQKLSQLPDINIEDKSLFEILSPAFMM